MLRLFSLQKTYNQNELLKPIVDQKRIDLFSLLSDNIIKTYISSTGIDGYNNLHYPIFLKILIKNIFSMNLSLILKKNFLKTKLIKF